MVKCSWSDSQNSSGVRFNKEVQPTSSLNLNSKLTYPDMENSEFRILKSKSKKNNFCFVLGNKMTKTCLNNLYLTAVVVVTARTTPPSGIFHSIQ